MPWHCTRYPRPAGLTLCSLGPFTSRLGMGHPGKPEAATCWETGFGGHLGPQVASSLASSQQIRRKDLLLQPTVARYLLYAFYMAATGWILYIVVSFLNYNSHPMQLTP